jgi:hypothetical protein
MSVGGTKMHFRLLLIFVLLVFQWTAAADPESPSIQDLSWIAGHWEGNLWEGKVEEIWSPADGDSMMGMFRYVKDGKIKLYEFMSIEQGTHRPVLRLKHFNPGLIGWEEKNESLIFNPVDYGKNEVSFMRDDKSTKITYRRNPDGTLLVVLEREKEGKKEREEFLYRPRK